MHRKWFLSVVILFGALFSTQLSCKFPFSLMRLVQQLTHTPIPPFRINYTPHPFPPTLTQIQPQPAVKIFGESPSVSNEKRVIFIPSQEKFAIQIPTKPILDSEEIHETMTPSLIAPTITKTHLAITSTFSPSPPTPSETPFPFFGKLLISKVMYNPVGDEPENEWIELYNPENVTVEISSFKIGDEESPNQSEGMMIFPQNSFIQPFQVIVIANQANVFYDRFGRYPFYEINESEADVPNMSKYTRWSRGNVSLNNENDEVLLLDGADCIVDMVSWSKNPSGEILPSSKEGSAIERMPASQDTNTHVDWVEQNAPAPFFVELNPPTPSPMPVSGKKTAAPTKTSTATATLTPSPTSTSTPTASATSPPTPNPNGRLVISEVMFNISPLNPYDVWIEIFNHDNFPVDLTNYHVGDDEDPYLITEGMYTFPPGAVIQPLSFITVAYAAYLFETEYNHKPDYEILDSNVLVPNLLPDENFPYGTMYLSCNGDEVLLLYIDHMLTDAVAWGNSTFFLGSSTPQPPFSGISMDVPPQDCSIERINKDADSNTRDDWQFQCTPSPGY